MEVKNAPTCDAAATITTAALDFTARRTLSWHSIASQTTPWSAALCMHVLLDSLWLFLGKKEVDTCLE